MVQHLLEFLDETAGGLQWAVPQWGSGGKALSVLDRGEHLPSRGETGEEGLGSKWGRRGSRTPAWLEVTHQEWRG